VGITIYLARKAIFSLEAKESNSLLVLTAILFGKVSNFLPKSIGKQFPDSTSSSKESNWLPKSKGKQFPLVGTKIHLVRKAIFSLKAKESNVR
jgi:hypothetical protein